MQNTQNGMPIAQQNLDAAVNIGMQATRFWRTCATLQAQGANEVMEGSLRITRTILKTQSDIVEAAGQLLSEGQRVVQENIERTTREGAEAAREAGSNGSHALQQAQPRAGQQGQQAKSQEHHRRAS